MLYLVGGTSRSGKTLIAKKILAEKQIPYLSLDWLMMGFNDGIPEYGIHHLLWPDAIAKKMSPFLQGMINSMLVENMDYVIEGEAMLPQLVAELIEKHPDRVKVAFVGYTEINVEDKVAQVKKHVGGEDDWLTNELNIGVEPIFSPLYRFYLDVDLFGSTPFCVIRFDPFRVPQQILAIAVVTKHLPPC